MNFPFNNKEYSDEQLNKSIRSILDSNTLMAVATVKDNSNSHIHTAYFCYNDNLELFMLTEPFRQHSLNIEKNNLVAVAIYDSKQVWDEPKRGLQLFGTCSQANGSKMVEAFALYAKRFSGLKQWVTNAEDILKNIIESRFYMIKIQSLKIFDEPTFGSEVSIPLTITTKRP